MTTIAGVEAFGGVVLGADSMARIGDDDGSNTDGCPKLWRPREDVVMGFSGSYRHGQCLKYWMNLPKGPTAAESNEEWLTTSFVNEIREAYQAGGVSNGDGEWAILMGIGPELWQIDGFCGVMRSNLGYHAIGSGGSYALGSLFTTASVNYATTAETSPDGIVTPDARLAFALSSAAQFSFATRAPFQFENNYPYTMQQNTPAEELVPDNIRRIK